MSRLWNTCISGLRLIVLYKNIFSLRHIFFGVLNSLFRHPAGFPITINLLITNKCNYSCRMCVGTQDHGMLGAGKDCDLPSLERFIKEIACHKPIIHIGGGEPFVRKDIMQILSSIKNQNLKCLMTTNGFLMDVPALLALPRPIDILIVSLYGCREVHDKVVGIPGAFDRSWENIRLLVRQKPKGMRVLVSCVVLPEAISGIPSFLQKVRLLGVDAVKVEHLNFLSSQECANEPHVLRDGFNLRSTVFRNQEGFSDEFVLGLDHLTSALPTSGLPVYMKPHLTRSQIHDWYLGVPHRDPVCRFITHSVFINHNGDIIPCQFLPDCVLGNIKENSLADVWRSEAYQKMREVIRREKPVACRRCCKN